jgi:hypothetical protein
MIAPGEGKPRNAMAGRADCRDGMHKEETA